MSRNTSASPKAIPMRRVLLTGLINILGIALTTGVIWIQTDHVIAPPGLRLIDALWNFFICRCPVFPHLLSF
jgi:hypothetical protein